MASPSPPFGANGFVALAVPCVSGAATHAFPLPWKGPESQGTGSFVHQVFMPQPLYGRRRPGNATLACSTHHHCVPAPAAVNTAAVAYSDRISWVQGERSREEVRERGGEGNAIPQSPGPKRPRMVDTYVCCSSYVYVMFSVVPSAGKA